MKIGEKNLGQWLPGGQGGMEIGLARKDMRELSRVMEVVCTLTEVWLIPVYVKIHRTFILKICAFHRM